MTFTIRARHLALVAVGVLVGVLVGGVAWASIPDSSGVVHACYQNVTSANKPVKLLDTAKATACPSGWTAVTWNQKGVQGPPGPSNAYAAYHDAAVGLLQSGSTLLTLNLAPGSYVVTAKAQIDTTSICVGGPGSGGCDITKFPTCTLTAGTDTDTVSQGTEGAESNGGREVDRMAAAMSLVVVHASTTSFTASFACADGTNTVGPMGTVATFSKLVAIKVGSVLNTAE